MATVDSICNACNRAISGKVITALEKKWHPEHFVCDECKKPIGGSFHQLGGKLICADDYLKNHTSNCKGCGKPVTDKVITAMNASWHFDHFVCKKCKNPIGSASFREVDGKPHCIPCHVKHYAPRCAGCSRAIESKTIIALDKNWHEECFKCGKCGKLIEDKSFAVRDKKPLCETCTKLY